MALFSMGGYGGYVWPSYVLALVLMVGLLAVSVYGARHAEKELARLQKLRTDRRGRDHLSGESAE